MSRFSDEASDCEKRSVNVGQEERWMSMFAAGAFAAVGLMRASPVFMLVGAGLALRGVTGHCMLYEATGVNTNKLQEEPQHRIAF